MTNGNSSLKANSLKAWMMCCRPKTWAIALSPVLVGLAIAFFDRHTLDWTVALATILLSVLMQAISNMENDAAYTRRNAERTNRKGLPRATSLGLLSVSRVEKAIVFLGFIVALDTLYLMISGGWVIIFISVASIVAAYLYMGGPKPLAFTPISEVVCFVFFGITAVCGTYYLQTQSFSLSCFFASCSVGFLATAVLVINNYRDIVHDASVKRMTLAVLLGPQKTRLLYTCLILLPFMACAGIILSDLRLYPVTIVLLVLPKCLFLIKTLPRQQDEALNAILFSTVKLELSFSSLLTVSVVAASLLNF